MDGLREYALLLKRAGQAWMSDNASSMGAALAFYSAFALAPLLLILSALTSQIFGVNQAHQALLSQVQDLIGPVGSLAVGRLLDQTTRASTNVVATVIGVAFLVVGASSVMIELQQDLDRIWAHGGPPTDQPFWTLVRNRVTAFILICAFGLVLLVSLLVGTVLNAVVFRLPVFAQHSLLLHAANSTVTLLVFTLLFAMLFKYLPRVKLGWRDVWHGAFVTALLLTAGQVGISYYLGRSSTTSAYAAAASVLVLLLWLYYAAQIFLFGAEFVWVYVRRHHPSRTGIPTVLAAPDLSVPPAASPQ
jgi:membrane protein